ncbi:uncharacterized protein BDCG_17298 [Blastomyces dermatitidis ER-3]|uniref:Uncharacterized protein n=1 Tax=Ajellomyces dermatitidis (strain ER-3 / ATCC MYA-2586) TaxID=559297 RepID=A0ABX2VXP9_AJEDR|nr:uncharacterized protein BDCG_17298 [Blastomyces dermatitidis ER-3]OAT01933.1 hypothetical protein BDCG_17298 [Blastomyces dermatitidis ER-3]
MRLYIIILAEKRGDVAMMMREAEKELNTDELTSRRDDISLQDTVTITAAAREVEEEEEEDVIIRVMLLQFINTAVFTFN